MEPKGKKIDQLRIGEKASLSRKITEEDINNFAQATGDLNPVHLDEAYAKNTIFQGRIAHGMLTASLFSNLLAMQLPGAGTVYLSQTLNFKRPVRIDDTITAEVEIIGIDLERGRVTLATRCRNQDDKVVLEGEAVVSPKR